MPVAPRGVAHRRMSGSGWPSPRPPPAWGAGLARLADWARWAAIAAGILVILVAVALPLATPRGNGSPLAIDPLAVLLGASGLLLVVLLAKPYRTD